MDSLLALPEELRRSPSPFRSNSAEKPVARSRDARRPSGSSACSDASQVERVRRPSGSSACSDAAVGKVMRELRRPSGSSCGSAAGEPRGRSELQRRPSLTSIFSGSSKSSHKSRDSLSTAASKLFRFRSLSRTKSHCSSSSEDSKDEVVILVGDICETASLVTVRSLEAFDSEVVAELDVGVRLEIIELGAHPRRAKMASGTLSGWISMRTELNYPLITKTGLDSFASFQVGIQYQVLTPLTFREGESLDSKIVCDIQPGTLVTIVLLGAAGRRARVSTTVGDGWISLSSRQGQPLVGLVQEPKGRSSMFAGSHKAKVRTFLEAARCGDLETLQKVGASGRGNFLGFSKFSINCHDMRGMTALMYAAAFGHRNVVEYLLFQKLEVDVNAADGSKKTALHHATKRAITHPRPIAADQSVLIQAILDSGASLEARDQNGCTPLLVAAAYDDVAATVVLLKAGADVNAKDDHGESALDYASFFGHPAIRRLLLSAGATADADWDEESSWSDCSWESTSTHESLDALFLELPRTSVSSSSSTAPSDEMGPEVCPQICVNGCPLEIPAVEVPKKPRVKARAKGKAKTKAKAKARTKAKVTGEGIAENGIVAEVNAAKRASFTGKVKVSEQEVTARRPSLGEHKEAGRRPSLGSNDPSRKATETLLTFVENAIAAPEIEDAIKVAFAAGADFTALQKAERKVKELTLRAAVLDQLEKAMEKADMRSLQAAIAEAETSGLDDARLERARAALQQELTKEKARKLLNEAKLSGDVSKLQIAIGWAQRAKLPSTEIEFFEGLLYNAESKSAAVSSLKAAMVLRDVDHLKSAIEEALDLGVDDPHVSAAERLLQEEEPKLLARQAIRKALEAVPVDMAAIAAAVRQGKKARLQQFEYADGKELLRKEALKDQALPKVSEATATPKGHDTSSMEAISLAHAGLSSTIQAKVACSPAKSNTVKSVRNTSSPKRRLVQTKIVSKQTLPPPPQIIESY